MTNLPQNRETSDKELNKYGYRNIRQFRGTYNRNEFPEVFKSMKDGDSIIINLDPDWSQGGTHWTAIRKSSEAPIVYYIDSFGVPPPNIVTDVVKKSGYGLLYGDSKRQKLKEVNCGPRALHVLELLADGASRNLELETFESVS